MRWNLIGMMVMAAAVWFPGDARAQDGPRCFIVAVMDIEFVGLKQSQSNVDRLVVPVTGWLGASGRPLGRRRPQRPGGAPLQVRLGRALQFPRFSAGEVNRTLTHNAPHFCSSP